MFLTLGGLALFLAGIEKLFGWFGRIFFGVLTLTVCFSFLPSFKTNIALFSVFIIALILHLLLDKHFRSIIVSMSAVFIFSLFIFPVKHQLIKPKQIYFKHIKANKKLPVVIHLMLDEHAGIDGIPTSSHSGKLLRKQLENFYLKNGFHLYANAYSHYVRTFNSVSNLINFSANPESHHYFNHNSKLLKNKYFRLMSQAGFKIRVYQFNSMINYCEPNKYNIESCYDYPGASLYSIKGHGFSSKNKFLFMLKSYLLWSHTYQLLITSYQYYLLPTAKFFHINLPTWAWYQSRTSALLIPEVFKKIALDVKQNPHGTFFYAHILGPHNPYVFNANCQVIKDPMSWQINISADPTLNTPQTRLMRYQLYENQVRCVTKQVSLLIKDLKKEGVYKNTILIINGDHGSRITENLPVEKLKKAFTKQDFHDCFNAFFAAKIPKQKAMISYHYHGIQNLLAMSLNQALEFSIKMKNTPIFAYMITPGYHGKMVPLYSSHLKMPVFKN